MATIQLTLDPNGDTVTMKLSGFLGRELFGVYRDVCFAVGARYVPAEKSNRAPVTAVPQLIEELAAAELPVEVDPQIGEILGAHAEEATEMLREGRERVEASGLGSVLYPYQRTGVEWLAPRRAALLSDEMGLGKTVQALVALPRDAAAMVVAPAAVSRNWANECERWRPDLKPVVLAGRAQLRFPRAGEVVIITYGALPKTAEEIPGTPEIGTVLMADEAHMLKNPKTLRRVGSIRKDEHGKTVYGANGRPLRDGGWDALRDAVFAFSGRVWLITGTPLLNRPPELRAVLDAAGLFDEAFGSWHQFVRLFDGRKGRYGYDWGAEVDEVEVAMKLRKVMLRRRLEEVLPDLPKKTRKTTLVNGLDASTRKLCDQVWARVEELGIDFEDAKTDLQKSLGGVLFEELSKVRAALATAKIPAMIERIEAYEEEGIPVVVFATHKAPVHVLGERDGWAYIDGGVSADKRAEIVKAFQGGRLKGIAGTIGAMGVGVTLTHAHHLMLVGLDWTPALNQQAEDRVRRIGQEAEHVFIETLLVNHPVEERVCELLRIKQTLIEQSVEAAAVSGDERESESPAEQLVASAANAQKMIADVTEKARVAKEREAVRSERERAELMERLERLKLDAPVERPETRGNAREAVTAQERWAGRALITLARLDPDRASCRNDVGFNGRDGEFGHSVAEQLGRSGMLTERQWAAAIRMCRKYHRQVGPCPA